MLRFQTARFLILVLAISTIVEALTDFTNIASAASKTDNSELIEREAKSSQLPITIKTNVSPHNPENGGIISPDGRYVAISDGSSIKLWDIATGRPLRNLEHPVYVHQFALLDNGSLIASAHKDGYLRVWSAQTGEMISEDKIFPETVFVSALRHDATRSVLVVAERKGHVVVWDYVNRAIKFDFEDASNSELAADDAFFSADGKRLLIAGGGVLRLVDPQMRQVESTIALPASASGSQIIDDRTIVFRSSGKSECEAQVILGRISGDKLEQQVIDEPVECRSQISNFEYYRSYGRIKIAHDSANRVLYVSRNGVPTIKVWDLAANRLRRALNWQAADNDALIGFDESVQTAAALVGQAVRILNLSDGSVKAELRPEGTFARQAGASSNGREFFIRRTRENQHDITVWSHERNSAVHSTLTTPEGFSVFDVSIDSGLFLAGSKNGKFGLFAVNSGKEISAFAIPRVRNLYSMKLSPDGTQAIIRVSQVPEGRAPFLGINVESVGEKRARELGLTPLQGVFVSRPVPGGPGEKAGVRTGDIVLSVRETPTNEPRGFIRAIEGLQIGSSVNLTVLRAGGRLDVALQVGERELEVENVAVLVDVRTRSLRLEARPLGPDRKWVSSGVFSNDGSRFALGSTDATSGIVKLYDTRSLELLSELEATKDQTTSLVFSSDGLSLIGGSRDSGVYVWDLANGKLRHELKRASFAGHVNTGSVAISRDGMLVAAGPYQRAVSSGDIGVERRVQVWNAKSGERLYLLSGHESGVGALVFTDDNRWLVSGSYDGTLRYWNAETGRLAATFATSQDGRWAFVTDNGFFSASPGAGNLLSVVSGYTATSIEQLWQSLYAPDLVREYLSGDISEEVSKAAAVLSLGRVLDSGNAPVVAISSPTSGTVSAIETIAAEATISARDHGGIGRVEWRVNGVTVGVSNPASGSDSTIGVKQTIALDPGENIIEVVAYNGRNLLASVPERAMISWTAPKSADKPKLHVLAIGVNKYIDQGGREPGTTAVKRFPPLGLAVSDATAFAAEFKKAGGDRYGSVIIRTVLDEDATVANLDNVFSEMEAGVHARDTFVVFAAAHGFSIGGRYYLIPQDYQGGPDPVALATRAIDQFKLQDWIANRIKAKKALILLDTCESGALTSGYTRSRFDGEASDAAVGRLHEATGRPVLTAAALGQDALELTELGHGVFTSALIDALYRGDTNGDGDISVSELAVHVQVLVPKLIRDPKIRAEIVHRGMADGVQSARFGSRGEDFVLVRRLQ